MDRFKLVREIGSGSYGNCYLAKRHGCNSDIVIKQLIKKRRAIFENECRILSSLKHPFIIAMHEHFETDTHLNIIMDYAAGGSLSTRIKEKEIRSDLVFTYFNQLAQALHYLHSKNILHRDVKSDNVFLNSSHSCVLLGDFGSAIDRTFAKEEQLVNDNRGTREYSAPEMLSGIVAVNEKCDMWSLGCVLYEMIERRSPFTYNCPFSRIENWEYDPIKRELPYSLTFFVEKLIIDHNIRWRAKDVLEHIKQQESFTKVEDPDIKDATQNRWKKIYECIRRILLKLVRFIFVGQFNVI